MSNTEKIVIALILAGAVLSLAGRVRRAAGEAVDITSDTNLAARAVNQLGDILVDGEDNNNFSLGRFVFEQQQELERWFQDGGGPDGEASN